MPYVRHTGMSFDPYNYDAMMTYMKTMFDMAERMPDLKRARLVRVADDRIIGTTSYTNKEAAEAASELARPAMAGLAEFMTGQPNIMQGEVVWGVDSDNQSKPAGYIRHTAVSFDPSKFDTMISFFDGVTDQFREVPGLIRTRVVRVLEDRIIGTSAFENKASADNAIKEHSGIMANMVEFTTGAPNVREGSIVWSHDK